MTQTSAFHFESLVWDWPIAIYLFLIGISAGLVTLAVLLRRVYPQAGGADSTLLRTTLIVGPGAVILGLLILVFHLTRPWTFWKLMFHYSFTSVMSMGVMLFQLYMVVLLLWLAKIFEHDLLALQQRWLPKLGIVVSSVSRQEISLNLQPGQQVTLAGYTFRFERLDLQAKGNYTSEKAIVALFDHQQRIGELMPERRFYEARRQQMMEPSIRWNGIHDWYAVMGEKTGLDRYAFRLYVQSGVRWIWGGGLLMIAGALLSGWRGRKRDE